MNYRQARIKRHLEDCLVFPFILIGRMLAWFMKPPIETSCFLFFPSADLGGAPKVNADITSLLRTKNPLIVFSKKPKNNGFLSLFQLNETHILDLHRAIDQKAWHWLNFIWRGILSAWINKAESPLVIGGECMYFYKIVPWLKPHVRVIEIAHLDTWLNYNQAFVPNIDVRICSTPKLKRTIETQYQQNGVPSSFAERIVFIDNWVTIPPPSEMPPTNTLQLLFVGRGAPQKRVYLLSKIAEILLRNGRPVHFTFVGDVETQLSEYVKENSTCYWNISDPAKLNEVYLASHMLVLTSAYEGLPIVVMDMMVRGRVVLSTAVDGIPDYIHHQENGLLICEVLNETILCEEAVALIESVLANPEQLQVLGKEARKQALQQFSKEAFEKAYWKILFP
jgi:glycosyltransferase involved in cell wall biosynthesis